MIINLPKKSLTIDLVVFDYNGTIAFDGELKDEVKEFLKNTSLNVAVLTADTFGSVRENLKNFDVEVVILKSDNHTKEKAKFVKNKNVIAVGNGNNDKEMLKEALIGICVIGEEGSSKEAILNSDIVVNSIKDAIGLIQNPKRLVATLRE